MNSCKIEGEWNFISCKLVYVFNTITFVYVIVIIRCACEVPDCKQEDVHGILAKEPTCVKKRHQIKTPKTKHMKPLLKQYMRIERKPQPS